ncbi:MAG: hypothetical protein H7836_17550, partial [Magnetococcus sp. YQC-3]
TTTGNDYTYDPVLDRFDTHYIKVTSSVANTSTFLYNSNGSFVAGTQVTTVLADNTPYFGYGAYFYYTTNHVDYWGYNAANDTIAFGGTSTAGACSRYKMECKWTVIGKYASTEPSFTLGSEIRYNRHPEVSNPSPANGTTGVAVIVTWSCSITDDDGDTVSWNISCSNGQYNTGSNTNGTRSINLVGLAYLTNYSIFVNVSDTGYDNNTGNYTFWFITLAAPTVPAVYVYQQNYTFFSLIFNGFSFVSAEDYIIDGDRVYIDNDNVYISLSPHTLNNSGFIYVQVISKKFSGLVDVAFGFNLSNCYPTECFIYQGGNWVKINKLFNVVRQEHWGYDRWYLLREVTVTQGVTYNLKINVSVLFNASDGKYFFGIKRSVDPISSAYVIDPWYNNDWEYYKKITVANNVVGYQTRIIVTNSVTLGGHLGQADFGD